MKELPTPYLQGRSAENPGPVNVQTTARAANPFESVVEGLGVVQGLARSERLSEDRAKAEEERQQRARERQAAAERAAENRVKTQYGNYLKLDLANREGGITESFRQLSEGLPNSDKPPHTWYGELIGLRNKLLEQSGRLYGDDPTVEKSYVEHINSELEQYGGRVMQAADEALTAGALLDSEEYLMQLVRGVETNQYTSDEALAKYEGKVGGYSSLLISESPRLLSDARTTLQAATVSMHVRVAETRVTDPSGAAAAFDRARTAARSIDDVDTRSSVLGNIDRLERNHMTGVIPRAAEGNVNAAAQIGLEFARSRPGNPVAGQTDGRAENRLDVDLFARQLTELLAAQQRLRSFEGQFGLDLQTDLMDALVSNLYRPVNEANNLSEENTVGSVVNPLRNSLLQIKQLLTQLPQTEQINRFIPDLETALDNLNSRENKSTERTNEVTEELLNKPPKPPTDEPTAAAPSSQSTTLQRMDDKERGTVFRNLVEETGNFGEVAATFQLNGVTNLPYAQQQFRSDLDEGNVLRFQDMVDSMASRGANLNAGTSHFFNLTALGEKIGHPLVVNALLFANQQGDEATLALMGDRAFVQDMARAGQLIDGKIRLDEQRFGKRRQPNISDDPAGMATMEIIRGDQTVTVQVDPMHDTVFMPANVVTPDGKTEGRFSDLYFSDVKGDGLIDPSMAHFRAASFAQRSDYFRARYAFHYANRRRLQGGEFGQLDLHEHAMNEAAKDAAIGMIGVPSISNDMGSLYEGAVEPGTIRRRGGGAASRYFFGKYDGTFQFMPLLPGLGNGAGELSDIGQLIVQEANNFTDSTMFGFGETIKLNGSELSMSTVSESLGGADLINKCRPCFDQIGVFEQSDGAKAYLLPFENEKGSENLFEIIFYESPEGLKVRLPNEDEQIDSQQMPRVPKIRTDSQTGAALPHLEWKPQFGALALQEIDPKGDKLAQFVYVARSELGLGATQPEIAAYVDALVKEHGWPSVRTT